MRATAGTNDISSCLHVQDAQDRKEARCPGQADKTALQPQASREPASTKAEEGRERRVPEHAVDDKLLSNSDANQATPCQPGRQAASAAWEYWQDKRPSYYCRQPTCDRPSCHIHSGGRWPMMRNACITARTHSKPAAYRVRSEPLPHKAVSLLSLFHCRVPRDHATRRPPGREWRSPPGGHAPFLDIVSTPARVERLRFVQPRLFRASTSELGL